LNLLKTHDVPLSEDQLELLTDITFEQYKKFGVDPSFDTPFAQSTTRENSAQMRAKKAEAYKAVQTEAATYLRPAQLQYLKTFQQQQISKPTSPRP